QLHDVQMAAFASKEERGRAVAQLRIDVHAFVEELLDGRGVALAGRFPERLGFFTEGLRSDRSRRDGQKDQHESRQESLQPIASFPCWSVRRGTSVAVGPGGVNRRQSGYHASRSGPAEAGHYGCLVPVRLKPDTTGTSFWSGRTPRVPLVGPAEGGHCGRL